MQSPQPATHYLPRREKLRRHNRIKTAFQAISLLGLSYISQILSHKIIFLP
jgi:hypothetical protein